MKKIIDTDLGQWVVRKIGGKIIMTSLKKRKKIKLSENQQGAQRRFIKAVAYAKWQMDKPEMKALYETGINKKKLSAYTVALTDALKAPEVDLIETINYYGAVGDTIVISAIDDFKVHRVLVKIIDSDGNRIECGEAVQHGFRSALWTYTATVENFCLDRTRIVATAFDYPGNEGTLETSCVHSFGRPTPAEKTDKSCGKLNKTSKRKNP